MPIISKGEKVLVTGVNGYIAMWTARIFLERGYAVRGTVRADAKAKFVKDYFASLGYGDRIEFAIIEDISKSGAFDEVVKDVDGIAHMASPVHSQTGADPEETLQPAIQGTVGILESALKYGKQVKRIVVTSSCAAVLPPVTEKPTVYSELDWDIVHPEIVKEKGKDAPPLSVYCASKTLSERAAWEFHEKHKDSSGWDLCVITPPFVYGPPIHDIPSPSSLNFSLAFWYNAVLSEPPESKAFLIAESNAWADVRDVALAHVLALEKPDAGGERIITSAVDEANSLLDKPRKLTVDGYPETTKGEKVHNILYDRTKERRIFMAVRLHI
uniref:NAD-dependent epimerase/dehydratase domain-containing protein n=1 Tax=Psilocybe cubensis TaxID=181762 RepID=A0A8H7Y8V9_PSICU